MVNVLIWAIWILKIAFNLLGKMGRFRKEVPEAIDSIRISRNVIIEKLHGGLTEAEAREVIDQLEKTWGEIDDVVDLFTAVIPVKLNSEISDGQ